MENIVYGASVSRGSYDDFSRFYLGVFTTQEKAQENLDKLKDRILKLDAKYSAEESYNLQSQYELEKFSDIEEYSKEVVDYMDWLICDDRYFNIGDFKVVPITLDKIDEEI